MMILNRSMSIALIMPPVVTVALLTALVGCAGIGSQGPAAVRLQSFTEAEVEPYTRAGTASLSGEAFLRTKGGKVMKGAGSKIFLYPAIPYVTEHIYRELLPGEELSPEYDHRIDRYARIETADSEGRFTFNNLPAGSYYAFGLITWAIPYRSTAGYAYTRDTGGWAVGQSTIADGESGRIIVTH